MLIDGQVARKAALRFRWCWWGGRDEPQPIVAKRLTWADGLVQRSPVVGRDDRGVCSDVARPTNDHEAKIRAASG